MIAVSRILETGRPATLPVARRDGEVVTFAELQRDVAALLAQLQGRPAGRWLVFCEDSYAFAVAMLGVLHAGSTLVLPPNGQVGTLAELSTDAQGLVTDRPAPNDATALSALGHPPVAPPKWSRLEPGGPHVELLTSGTTGKRKVVPKGLAQLDAELAVLERTFGSLLADATVAASVSHQHIYGLLFRVLWPLAAGRPFVAETPVHPEELLAGMEDVPRWALISSPVHLRRMKDLLDPDGWSGRCALVTSSGAPLDQSTAHAWAAGLGAAPVEVLGSTETGGVAWRRQAPGDDTSPWTPLAGVELGVDPDEGLLRVRSPFAGAASEPDGLCMGDRARMLQDGRFVLLGRADRIVKVGGKRLSLVEMEQHLAEHPAVREAGVVQLDDQRQGRTAAALVLTDTGRRDVESIGRRGFHERLRDHLLDAFDPVTIPRAWVHLDALPSDPNGKVTQPGLRALFIGPDQGDDDLVSPDQAPSRIPVHGEAWWPRILARLRTDDACEWTLTVPKQMPVLAGHFPNEPIVPGIAQIGWVMEAAAELLQYRPAPQRFEAVKFRSVIRPGTTLTLRVERLSRADRLGYRLFAGETIYASGRIVLAPVKVDACSGPAS